MKLQRRGGLAASFALLAALQWAVSFLVAGAIRTVGTYDTAYYYVIARNLAQGRGLLDTVVWQYLGAPRAVARPAGDYWEVGWPLVLGALMRVFDTSQRASILLCAALSGLLPVLTALVARLATRRADVAWTAGLLVVAQTRLWPTDATPDATLAYQLTTLGALAVFYLARDRALSPGARVAAGAALILPAYVRGEGFVVAACLLLLLFFAGEAPLRDRARRLAPPILGVALVVLPFTIRNQLVYGLLPTGRSLRFWMRTLKDLDRFASDPTPAAWWAQGPSRLLYVRYRSIVGHLAQLTIQIPWPLLVLAAVGVAVHVSAERRRAAAIPSLVVASLLVPCLLVPIVANPDRFVMNTLPLFCILAAHGVFALVDRARRAVDHPAVAALVVGAAVLASSLVYREGGSAWDNVHVLRLYGDAPPVLSDPEAIAPLRLGRDDVVLTDDPLRVAAVLDVAAIFCPTDGPAAVEALVDRYRPRFVLVGSRALERLVKSGRFPFRAVSSAGGATWYELSEGVRNADGSAR